MIRVLHLKATSAYLYYLQNNNLKYLSLANRSYQTAFDFHNKLQQDISTENSRLFQAKNMLPYLENALKVAYELQEKGQDISESAFRFMEKNKATVLLQAINEADALQFANLPDSLMEQEKDLKIAISYYEQQLNDAKLYGETITEINELENTLFENNGKYQRLIKNLEENYPDYYQLKYQQNQVQLADLQNLLDDQTAILEYFVGDSSIFILSIAKNQSKLYKINKPDNWQLIIKDYKANVDPNGDEYLEEIIKCFIENASVLYQNLLQQPLADLGKSINHIQIISDAELNSIPFGLFLTKTDHSNVLNYVCLPYLLKEKMISYAYSGALLVENKDKAQQTFTHNYAGFAPNYQNYPPLNYAKSNTENIAKLLNGKSYVDHEATVSNFKKDIHQFRTFHLAMHGELNDANPLGSKLIFSDAHSVDHELHTYELYNMKIPTELGVLSACETGTGLHERGEGIMSLSRAFTYAGCNSLVMSLWSIDDEATANIVGSFFINLSMSDTNKDEALRNAKVDYLNNAKSDKTHPKYWAGLVLIGDVDAIDF